MAAIVNERDLILQATTPRLVPVALPENVEVDIDSVIGAGELAKLDFVNAETQVTNLGDLALVDVLLANQIGAGTLPVGVIYAGTIQANQIGSGTLPVGVIYAGEINADQVNSGAFTGETFTGGTFSGARILGSDEISVTNNGDFTFQGAPDFGGNIEYKAVYNGTTGVFDMSLVLNQYGPTNLNTLAADGNVAFGQTLDVQGLISAYGGINTYASSQFNGNVSVSGGNFSVSGPATVSQRATFNGGVDINDTVGGSEGNKIPMTGRTFWVNIGGAGAQQMYIGDPV